MKILLSVLMAVSVYSCKNRINSDLQALSLVNASLEIEDEESIHQFSKPLILEPVEYIEWIEGDEKILTVQKNISGFQYSLTYQPLDYKVLTEGRKLDWSMEEFEQGRDRFKDLQFFILKVSPNSQDEFIDTDKGLQSNNYLSFSMQNDIKLLDKGDTLPCVMYHHETTYNLAPHRTFILGFERTEEEKKAIDLNQQPFYTDKFLMFSDKIFAKKEISISFSQERLNRMPMLKLNE